jgi:predicted nucleic acid-binding protein
LSRSKFSFDEQRVDALLNAIKLIGIYVTSDPCEYELPDESDRAFLESALSAEAYLVTGNIKHFPGFDFVVTPAEFIKLLGD